MDVAPSQTRPVPAPITETSAAAPDVAWRDRLVELQVLAEHGDSDAAAIAARWLAADPAARHAWSEVERICQHLRAL